MKLGFFAIAALLVIVSLGFVVQRLAFLAGAERTVGQVTHVEARNDRCGGGKRRRSYACTKYRATVDFQVAGRTHQLSLGAGSARGSSQPVTEADYRVGGQVRVVHAPDGDPAYEDSTSGVWGTPLLTFFLAIASAFGGYRQRGT